MSDPTYPSSLTRSFIEALGKHLPQETARLRLADVQSRAGLVLGETRPDLEIIPVPRRVDDWSLAPDSVDVLTAYDMGLSQAFLRATRTALRPGGRLIVVNPRGEATPKLVKLLEDAGFIHIFVEAALDQPRPVGVLVRGEKPGWKAAGRIMPEASPAVMPAEKRQERFVHLLISQKVSVENNNALVWQAAAVAGDDETVMLAFSSLAKAIQFMQPAVVTGRIQDVNKVAKFNWSVAKSWPHPFMLNPTDDILESYPAVFVPVDPATAETLE